MKIKETFKFLRSTSFILAIFLVVAMTVLLYEWLKTPQVLYQFLTRFYLFLFAFVFLVFIVSAVGIINSINILRDVEKMYDFVEHISKGDFSARLETKRDDEIGHLADELNQMAIRLRDSLAKVKEEKEKALSVIENVGDSIIVINKEGKIALFNSAAEKITETESDKAVGKQYSEILKLSPAGRETIERAIRVGKRLSFPKDTFLTTNKYARTLEIKGNISPFVMKDGESSYILAFRDVTTERAVEKMKSEFISITSHQLRTPLASIRWYVEMLLAGDVGKLTARQEDFLSDIHDSTMTAIDLINNLLDLSRIERGKIKFKIEPLQLENIVNKIISEFAPLAEASNVKVVKEFPKKKLPKINLDRQKVTQVFSNLLANAIQYSPGKAKVILGLKRAEDSVVFSCKDFGIGIPEDEQQSIFKKFFRASNTAGVGAPGSGIGLYVCKYFTEQMGGKIWFESEGEGKGTTFYVEFPIIKNVTGNKQHVTRNIDERRNQK